MFREDDPQYIRGVDLVLDDGWDVDEAAAELRICPRLLQVWVENTRINIQIRAELEAEDEEALDG